MSPKKNDSPDMVESSFNDLTWREILHHLAGGGVFSTIQQSTDPSLNKVFTARRVTGEPRVFLLTLRDPRNDAPECIVRHSLAGLVLAMEDQGYSMDEWIAENE